SSLKRRPLLRGLLRVRRGAGASGRGRGAPPADGRGRARLRAPELHVGPGHRQLPGRPPASRSPVAVTRPPLRAVHQLLSNFDLGDAIGNHVRALRRLLQSWGYASDVFAQYRHTSFLKESHFYTTYRGVSSPDTIVLFHFSIGSEVT